MKTPFQLIFFVTLLCQLRVGAQNITVTGKVTAQDNETLSGVSIKVSGSKQGVATDAAGSYSISANANAALIFSYIGFVEQTIEVDGRRVINVTLVKSSDSMQTIVVTALGIKRELRTLGYATATVNNDQIATNRTPNVISGLQGKLSGVNITTMGTGPAGSAKIRIRGQSSFSSQNNPLIVLNGVPMDNTNYALGGAQGFRAGQVNSTDGGDGLSSINPDDIETMTVLKGATASALYGSRAKDGVIMITTKSRGTTKGVGVDYNINFTTDTPLDFTDFQYEYGQGERGVRPTTPFPQSGVWSFGEKFQPGMTQVLFDGKTFPYEPVRNRYKKFYNVGTNLTNTITLSTSGENGGLSLSLANTDNKGIMPNSKFNRRSVNLGFTQNVTSTLTLMGNINYSNEKNENPPQVNTQDMAVPTVLYTLANSMPFDAMEQNQTLPNGNEFVMSRFLVRNNPYYSVNKRFENIKRDRTIGNVSLKYEITNWLYLQGRLAQDIYTRYQDYNIPNGYAPIPAAPIGFTNGSYTQDIRRFRERNYDFLLGANRKVKSIGIDLTLGGNQMYRSMEYNSVTVQDFVQPGLYTVMNGRVKDPLYNKQERKVNSLYGAVEFSFRNFLYVNVTGRNDWFSTLAPANRSIFYPSVTTSFIFSEAFSTSMPAWLSYGKLRLAYAQVGDDNVAPYSDVLYYSVNNNLFPNPGGNPIPIGGISGSQIPNADLRPLRVSETEVGVELKLFNNRVGFDLSYYHKITRDQILGIQVSDASSYTNKLINVGKSMNQGLEMQLSLTPVQTDDFKWDVNFNGSYNTSEVLRLGPNPADTVITVGGGGGRFVKQVVGKPIGALYTFAYRRDAEGRQVFDKASGRPLRNDIQQYVGNVLPKYFGGITNSFNYSGIILTVLVDFKLGAKMIAGSNMNALRHGLHKRTLVGRAEGYVIGDGVNQDGGKNVTRADLQPFYETPNVLGVNEDFVFNSGFWKLRQISLGYDFTRYLKSLPFIKGIRLSAVANNVAILKKWTENMDPENIANVSDNETGLDFWTAVPPTRSIGFNLNVKF
ncbi:MAG: SusC/RagA family TonB-linked outer membrane protein [Chitinophagaceae bacterium]